MKSSLKFSMLLAIFIAANTSYAQYGGPLDFHGAVKIKIPDTLSYPPISGSMPPDVLTGYLVFDSLMHIHIDQHPVDSIISTITNSDTIWYALKYAYEMKDYDATAFFQLMELFPWKGEFLDRRPAGLFNSVLSRFGKVVPDSGRFLMSLAYCDGILDVTVRDTFSVTDHSKPGNANACEGVRCTIDEIIKGHNLPSGCTDTEYRVKGINRAIQGAPEPCLAFQYWLYWLSDIEIPRGVKTYNRTPWMVPDSEYIVFLKLDGLGVDSGQCYATLSPVGMSFSSLMGMYPVHGGIVYDPNNDFGFGVGLTVADFKSKLRQKIQTITNYHP